MENLNAKNCINLIVDDSDFTSEITSFAVESAGYKILITKSGLEALEILHQESSISTLNEIGNIIMVSYISAISNLINDKINFDLPETTVEISEKYFENLIEIINYEVLSAIKKEKYDIVLMDVQMPYLEGVEVTKIIRTSESDEFDPDIPIIALTAFGMDEDKKHFIDAGMNNYFIKPVIIDQLITKMIQLINKIKQ